jgi:hypothetical protein
MRARPPHLAPFSVQDVVQVTVVPRSHDLQAALIDVLAIVGTVEPHRASWRGASDILLWFAAGSRKSK